MLAIYRGKPPKRMSDTKPTHPYQLKFFQFGESKVETPKTTIATNKKWLNIGSKGRYDNSQCYLFSLIEMLDTSSIHNAVIEAKARAIAGASIECNKEALDTETYAKFQNFIKAPSPECNFKDLLDEVAIDWETYGAFCLEIIWSKNGRQIAEVHHLDPIFIKLGMPVDGEIDTYFYSADWTNYKKEPYVPVEIPAFNPETAKQDGRQLIYVGNRRPGTQYYGVPSYVAATNWIKLDKELSVLNLSNVQNGMNPKLNITFVGPIPSDEERQQVFSDMRRNFEGADGDKYMISFAENKDAAPIITPVILENTDRMVSLFNDLVVEKILTAHRVPNPTMFGIKTAGQLGGVSELAISLRQWEKDVIAPSRDKILRTFNRLLEYIVPGAEMTIIPNNPIEFQYSENALMKIMTVNELRQKVGLQPLTEQEVAELESKAGGKA